jgi:hypothetical protein
MITQKMKYALKALLVLADEAARPVPEGLTIEEIAAKDVPTGAPYKIVDASDLPSNRTERDLWTVDEASLTDGVGE